MQYTVSDAVLKICRHAATISRLKYQGLDRGLIPRASSETATVTFIKFGGRTFAVTAWHVIAILQDLAVKDGAPFEGYSCLQAPGVAILGPFLRPPAQFPDKQPDVAICPIHPDLPKTIHKTPFEIVPESDAKWPVPFAIAVGFPTNSKEEIHDETGGKRLALSCVHAVAEGLASPGTSDQVQFNSELPERPAISSLSGMSGGPVFWSDEERYGLIGFVKEALDVMPSDHKKSIFEQPKVNFVCQRVDFTIFQRWACYIEQNWQTERDKINIAIKQANPQA